MDCWTSIGGSQFLDSPGTGLYHSYLCDEVLPAVDTRFRTLADRDHRAVAGKSSGGYGAMVSALLRPDLFGALASHAGDALFEFCYLPEFPEVVRQLRDHFQGSYANFWTEFRSRPALSRAYDYPLLDAWAWPPAIPQPLTEHRSCPLTRCPASCDRTSGSAGSTGTR